MKTTWMRSELVATKQKEQSTTRVTNRVVAGGDTGSRENIPKLPTNNFHVYPLLFDCLLCYWVSLMSCVRRQTQVLMAWRDFRETSSKIWVRLFGSEGAVRQARSIVSWYFFRIRTRFKVSTMMAKEAAIFRRMRGKFGLIMKDKLRFDRIKLMVPSGTL